MAASDFYLEEDDLADPVTWRAPSRTGVTVTPLIDGRATFEALEAAAAAAQHTVYLTGWVFFPSTPLIEPKRIGAALRERHRAQDAERRKADPEAKPRPFPAVRRWPDLLAALAGLGVKVRVLLTDFDPVLHENHRDHTWPAYVALRHTAAARLEPAARTGLEVMCSLHDHEVATGFPCKTMEDVLKPFLEEQVRRINRLSGDAAKADALATRPGIWPLITFDPAATPPVAIRPGIDWIAHPVSHHQKTLVVDGGTAFCGGIDLSPLAVSECSNHSVRYHDLHCQVDGELAADLHRNFVSRWNRERPRFNTFVGALVAPHSSVRLDVATVSEATETVPPAAMPGVGTGQLLRTMSENSLISRTPSNLLQDIQDAYENAVGRAESFIYIENQYLRSEKLKDWILERCADVAGLVVIVTLPVAPEELKSRRPNEVLQLGMHLQFEILDELAKTLGPRFAVFSMAERDNASRAALTNTFGRRQIYTHSKALIVDDGYLLIGSANASPRSFRVDTEAAIGCADPAVVRDFRLALWGNLLGHPADLASWSPADFVSRWSDIATFNVDPKTKPAERQGWIVPHDHTRSIVRGAPQPFIPDLFAAEATDPAVDDVVTV